MVVDVAVVGAGLAGLTCARQLQQFGARVAVLEKSRGLGGRLATRRLAETWADHGVRYLEPQGVHTQQLLENLHPRAVLHPWTAPVQIAQTDGTQVPIETSRYVSDVGLTAVAKALAEDLEIYRGQRVVELRPYSEGWTLICEEGATEPSSPPLQLDARLLVLMIPAPQAIALLEPLHERPSLLPTLHALKSVEFDPCITAIAAYPASALNLPSVAALHLSDHPVLSWVSVEASKQQESPAGAIALVVQSSAAFAWDHLNVNDLAPIGHQLLNAASQSLSLDLTKPDLLQVHRWRYAFCRRPLERPYLENLAANQLICGGDWCGGRNVEQALASGTQTANAVQQHLSIMVS